jgi:DNA primase large subunit
MSIVAAKFRSHLSRSLAWAGTAFRQVVSRDKWSRIGPLLTLMNSQYTGLGGGNAAVYGIDSKGALTALNCDDKATQSMPLKMRMLHCGLQQDHKLKHQGQLQYGLFLKGVGMTLKEHTIFFQWEFPRVMTLEQFSKQYAYSIRHTHGKEGKRASYMPHNCVKIIMGNPPQGGAEHHGCPYRHYEDASLGVLLGQLNIASAVDRDMVMLYKRDGHYQLVCARHFEAAHPSVTSLGGTVNIDGVRNHPNAWFTALVLYHNAKSGKA